MSVSHRYSITIVMLTKDKKNIVPVVLDIQVVNCVISTTTTTSRIIVVGDDTEVLIW